MEEKNVIRIKLSTAICITVIITILVGLVVLLGMYYFKNNTENEEVQQNNSQIVEQENIENDKTITSKEDEEIKNKKEQLDVKSDLVQKLYKYIPITGNIADENNQPMKTAYQSKKIKINDLENNIKLINSFKNLDLKEDEKRYLEGDWYYFDSKLLENRAIEIYGENVNIKNEPFEISWGAGCSYENGEYMYSEGGGGATSVDSIREIKEAYIEDNVLYIIDKFMLGMGIIVEDSNSELYEESYNLYTNTEANKLISKEYEGVEKSALINKYSDKMTEYKHTFEQGNNGEYYWYSSEPLYK